MTDPERILGTVDGHGMTSVLRYPVLKQAKLPAFGSSAAVVCHILIKTLLTT